MKITKIGNKKKGIEKKEVMKKEAIKKTVGRDYPLSPTPNPKDSIGVFQSRAAEFLKKDNARKDISKKFSSLTDSTEKYTDKVFNAARTMSKEDLKKNNISKTLTNKGDTVYNFKKNGVGFSRKVFKGN